MGMTELVVLAVGLAMDAFAVSVCKGLSAGRVTLGHALTAGLWFGGFQALMPFLGWLLGVQFQSFITSIDHWIAFVLLGLIGVKAGGVVGERGKSWAELAGGIVLILMGTKILLEHLGVLG